MFEPTTLTCLSVVAPATAKEVTALRAAARLVTGSSARARDAPRGVRDAVIGALVNVHEVPLGQGSLPLVAAAPGTGTKIRELGR